MKLHYKAMLLSKEIYHTDLYYTRPEIPAADALPRGLNSFAFGFMKINFDGKVSYWSAAAEQLTGYSAELVLNKTIFDTIPKINSLKFHKIWQKLRYERQYLRFTEYSAAAQTWLQFYAYPSSNHILICLKDTGKKNAPRKKPTLKTNPLKDISAFNPDEVRKYLAYLTRLADILRDDLTKEELQNVFNYIKRTTKYLDNISKSKNILANSNSSNMHLPSLAPTDAKTLLKEIKNEFAVLSTSSIAQN